MSTYSVADAKSGLPRLIDLALEGEEVIISRHGRPVAELRPIGKPIRGQAATAYAWLRERREKVPGLTLTSVELLDQMYEDPDA